MSDDAVFSFHVSGIGNNSTSNTKRCINPSLIVDGTTTNGTDA